MRRTADSLYHIQNKFRGQSETALLPCFTLMREIIFNIEEKDDNKAIKDYLKDFGVSSSLLTKLKKTENGITNNGIFTRSIDRVHTGDTLKIRIENKGTMPSPAKMDIETVYEDEDIIVFNKPPCIPVHESRNHRGDTLSNHMAYISKEQTAFRAVYRLDRDTSGLVLIAKHELSASKLAGRIKKDYYAVVDDRIEKDGTVDKNIARCGESIIKRCVSENGETAITEYFPIEYANGRTLVKFNLLTGRTHQIRVHMSYIGHPLLGDDMYGGDTSLITRQALHCKDIYFTHPITNEEMHLSCDFPDDIKALFDKL